MIDNELQYVKYFKLEKMKIKNIIFLGVLLILVLLPSCYKDEGNYDYVDVEELEIDTTGMNANDQNYFNVYVGDTLVITPNLDFGDSDNLTYEWLLFDYPYEAVAVGNSTEYPAPDTIPTTSKHKKNLLIVHSNNYTNQVLYNQIVL